MYHYALYVRYRTYLYVLYRACSILPTRYVVFLITWVMLIHPFLGMAARRKPMKTELSMVALLFLVTVNGMFDLS